MHAVIKKDTALHLVIYNALCFCLIVVVHVNVSVVLALNAPVLDSKKLLM